MKVISRFLLPCAGTILLGAALYLGCGGESSPRVQGEIRSSAARAVEPVPVLPDAPTRYHDGAVWKSAVWAADELQLVLAPGTEVGTVVPAASVFVRSDGEAGVRVGAVDRSGFAARAKELEGKPGVKQVRPVFYATAEALQRRGVEGRLILTRQVAATLPEGVSAEAVAARHGARVLSKLDFMERTWLFEAAGPFEALDVAASLRDREGLVFAAPQFARVQSRKGRVRLIPNDALFPNQWHLRNTVQVGEDINVVTAWDVVQGSGIVIGIIDDGLERTHEDLEPNYSVALSLDINGGDADPTPTSSFDAHGTACAGLAGARGSNSVGVSGVAPLATLAGIRLTAAASTDAQEAQAMSHQNAAIHVKSNSWGPDDDGLELRRPEPLTAAAFLNGVTSGRGGRGIVYTWAGGNGRTAPDNSNFDGYANTRHVIGVGAVNRQGFQTTYSESGANLLVVAPGGEADITSTDLIGPAGDDPTDYTGGFDGTSAATPIVAGVAALVLSRNPLLKARDVMHVLARTARKNDASDPGWTDNAAGFPVNHRYGFGVVDAAAAVALADRWPYVGPEASRSAASPVLSLAIPDNAPGSPVTHGLAITGAPFRIEHVEVDFSATHEFRGDLLVTLVAPSGTRSILAERRNNDGSTAGFSNWTFMSRRHWGEMAVGTWTIEVADGAAVDVGTFSSWSLRVYGTPVDTIAPLAGTVNDGPAGDVDILGSSTTVVANWPGFSDPESGLIYEWAVGTTPGGQQTGAYIPAGNATSASRSDVALSAGIPYFVSVRAANFEGLTTVATSDGFVIDILPPDAPAAPIVSPSAGATGIFTVSWAAPADPGGSGVASYVLRRSKDGGPFANVATGITLLTVVNDAGAAGGGAFRYQVGAVDVAGNAGAFSPGSAPVVFDPTPPTASITGPTGLPTFATGTGPLPLAGTAADNVGVVAVTWVNAATGQGGVATGTLNWTASVPLLPGSNAITVFSWDAVGNVGTDLLTVDFTPTDLLPPSITISGPTGADTFSTGATPLAMSGASLDDTGVTSVEWTNLRTGTRGTAVGTAFWTASVPLLAGANSVVATARDAAGQATSDTLTVTFTPAADVVLPVVDITSPTALATLATGTSPLVLGGTASDNAGLALVRWSNAATGGAATAAGLAAWSASIALAPGANLITVTAVDASGNESTDMLTATFTPPGGDAILPHVVIQAPSIAVTSNAFVTLAGLASDNAGALEVVWFNAATGDSGTATGVGAWSALVPLLAGVNAITVTAYDAAGNAGTALLAVTFALPSSGGGGGGGGGCGATGLESAVAALLWRLRRRFVKRV